MRNEYATTIIGSLPPIIVLLSFVIFFLSMLLWVFNKKRNTYLQEASQLPLKEDQFVHARNEETKESRS